MAKIYGQIENAQFENKASDYTATVVGRVWWNTATLKAKIADGTNVRSFLLNDDKIILGTNATANTNVRLNRAGTGLLQFVLGGDATAEGSLSTVPAQISSRNENYTTGARPAFGNAGRIIFNTTTSVCQFDTGAAWVDMGVGTHSVLAANFRQSVANSLVGNNTALTADVVDIAAASDGQVMRRRGGAIGWGTILSGDTVLALQAKTGNYTLLSTDDIVEGDATGGSFTFTLPSAVGLGGHYFVLKRTDNTLANTIPISGTIDGASDWILHTQNETYVIYSNNTAWKLVSHKTDTPWTAYTPTIVGVGTPSGVDFVWRRQGPDVYVEGVFVSGTSTATEFRIPLPTGLTSAAAPATIRACGVSMRNPGTATAWATLIEPSVTYTTVSSSASSGLAKLTGGNYISSGNSASSSARVQIAGWKN